jgi:hypothetical protein
MTAERDFGKALGDALGEGPPDVALRVQRANVLAAMHRGQRSVGRPRWELAAGLLVAAAAVTAVLVWRGRPDTLSAHWRGGVALAPASSLATGSRAEAIDFSDGSRVLLEPEATAYLVRLDPNHAELTLKRGKLEASVHHREGVSWSIFAGPYEVRVVGTKFTVDWEQASDTLRVAVSEGRVRVTGGDLGERVVQLEPGQHLERRGTPRVTAPAEPAPVPRVTEAPPPEPTRASRAVTSSPPVAAPSAAPPPPTIGELAKSGKYREALALAEQQGFERVIAELPEGELLGLGNAARYTGARSRARQAMLAVRSRFPSRPASELAALYLAKIAEQLDHDPKEAARWLRVFLSESPTGNLAADARASLLSILLASGDTAGATAVARDYLRYHPTGPVADRARVLVSRSESR